MDLGKKLRDALRKISGKPYIDEAEVKSLIKEIQKVLISSDVNIKLVFQLSKRIEKNALDKEKMKDLNLKEHVLKVVYDELAAFMGDEYTPRLDKHKILVCGLFGSGKTTSIGKLAYYYKTKGMKVGVVAADCDRPAAKEQLQQLAEQAGVNFYTIKEEGNPIKIVEDAVERSKDDVLIVDSAGRSAFNEELSKELKGINNALNPEEVYLVVSADIGQIAGKQTEAFKDAVPISGVIVTKLEGSGKGGGALSAVAAAETKIAFIGTGEKLKDLEIYNAERFVGKLLGLPDLKGLLEKVQTLQEEQDLSKLQTSEFTIETFYEQLKASKKMGPLGDIMGMMGLSDIPKEQKMEAEGKLKLYESIINSMTKAEKKDGQLLKKNRNRIERIAAGCGTTVLEVRRFLSQFEKMEKMLKKFKSDRGFKKKMEKMMKGGFNVPGMGM
uniref:Signal recognition particle 54 kDa protein n=1 Tax=uncultured marine group II/III euryarchaeote KM3_195_B08 TaxID=1457970 RepID=A0A075GY74_9EURY|nr:signal recognition particle protein (SRP54, ffh) [uncultured marine group II/III euryarchaeote KM3_195_B08]